MLLDLFWHMTLHIALFDIHAHTACLPRGYAWCKLVGWRRLAISAGPANNVITNG